MVVCSEGMSIRLLSEDDFLSRPRVTDPEILRTKPGLGYFADDHAGAGRSLRSRLSKHRINTDVRMSASAGRAGRDLPLMNRPAPIN
ncbi:hypothetical protein ACNKHU_10630 [Shigella flexneri]